MFLTTSRPAAAQGQLAATPPQLKACRTEVDRRLPDYTYDQVEVVSEGRDQNVANVHWQAGNQGGRCVVATNGRILTFTRDSGSESAWNTGPTTRLTCESRRGRREECRIPPEARIRLIHQLSDSPCRPNDTYGQGPGYIWVAEGCGGEFEVMLPGPIGSGGTMKVTCEAPRSGRRECRIPNGAQVRLTTQLSDAPCRLNDSYGVIPGAIWVQRGCRGVFEVKGGTPSGGAPGGNAPEGNPPAGTVGTTRVVCESRGAERQICPVAGDATRILLVKQYSSSPCRLNESFGAGFGHVWVSNGCRGEFEVTIGSTTSGGTGTSDRVTCESKGGERAECRIRTGAQVQLIRQLSTAECARNRTWGTGNGLIWVAEGCRGEFEVR
jgi:hypothetical protein